MASSTALKKHKLTALCLIHRLPDGHKWLLVIDLIGGCSTDRANDIHGNEFQLPTAKYLLLSTAQHGLNTPAHGFMAHGRFSKKWHEKLLLFHSLPFLYKRETVTPTVTGLITLGLK